MRKLTSEEKEALQKKLREEGFGEEGGRKVQLTLSDDKKKEMEKMIAQAERERIGRLDKRLHSRSPKKKVTE